LLSSFSSQTFSIDYCLIKPYIGLLRQGEEKEESPFPDYDFFEYIKGIYRDVARSEDLYKWRESLGAIKSIPLLDNNALDELKYLKSISNIKCNNQSTPNLNQVRSQLSNNSAEARKEFGQKLQLAQGNSKHLITKENNSTFFYYHPDLVKKKISKWFSYGSYPVSAKK